MRHGTTRDGKHLAPWLRAVSTLALAGLACAWPIAALAHHGDGPTAAKEARERLARHELRTLDGRTLTLGSLRGEVVVVSFWASWCRPCRRELPALDALHAEITPHGGRVIAVSIDERVENARGFVRAHHLTLPIVHDGPSGLARALDLDHVPYTIVLDRDGEVALAVAGADRAALESIGATTRRLVGRAAGVSQANPGGTP